MAAFTAAIMVAGLVINFIGQKKQQKALKQQAQTIEAETEQQAVLTTEHAKVQTETQVKQVDNSKKIEEQRRKEAKLKADAERRKNVRSFLAERSRSLSASINQGLGRGSTGVAGGQFAAASQFASNSRFIANTSSIQNRIFGLNATGAELQGDFNIANTAFQAQTANFQGRVAVAQGRGAAGVAKGQAVSSFGTQLFSNAKTVGNVAGTLFG